VRLFKRGPKAWDNAKSRIYPGSTEAGRNPLLVHTVGDRTNLANYLPALSLFLSWVSWHATSFSTPRDKDLALADYLAMLCYHCDEDVSMGKFVTSALLHVSPDLKGLIPHAARALTSWARLRMYREKEPIPESGVYAMIGDALEEGEIWEALGYALHHDTYCRGQDLEQLVVGDIAVGVEDVGLTYGDPARGESVKTGIDQGVVIDREWIRQVLRHLRSCEPLGRRVFRKSMPRYRALFKRRLKRQGLPTEDGPHRLRHSGAAADIRLKRRDPPGVQKRGRWAKIESVNVYLKEHLWIRMEEKMGEEVRTRGQYIIDNQKHLAGIWISMYEDARRHDPFDSASELRPASSRELQLLRPEQPPGVPHSEEI